MSKKPNINNLDLKASDLDVYTKGEIEENYSTKEELQDTNDTLMSHLDETKKEITNLGTTKIYRG